MNENQTDELQSIVYRRNWAELLLTMPPEVRHAIHDALDGYIVGQKMPDETDPIYWVFYGFVQQITKDKEKYNEIRKTRSNAGKKHKGNQYTRRKEVEQMEQMEQVFQNGTNGSVNVNVSVNDNVNNITSKEVREKRSRFVPPTTEEVRAYCSEKGYQVDPERFVLFYESKGWYVGKNKMKSWKAAVANWAKSDKPQSGNTATRRELDKQNKNVNDLWK